MFAAETINWLAVIVATVVHMVLGFLWYGPVFGNIWMAGMGKTREEMGSSTQSIVISGVSALVMAIALACLLTLPAPNTVNLAGGALVGAVAGIGFVATTAATGAAFEGKNRTVLLLGIGYQVVGLIIMGAILGAWR